MSTSTNVSDPDAETGPTDISATVVEEEGWDQVVDAVEDAAQNGESVNVTVYDATGSDVPGSVVDALAGKNVTMTILTAGGAEYVLDFSIIRNSATNDRVDFSYHISRLEDKYYEELDGADAYELVFNRSGTLYAEVLIQLPVENARKIVSLYQMEDGKPLLLQSVVADQKGIAHFYLASVDSEMDYLLGINVPAVTQYSVLIPDALSNEYGITDKTASVEYVATGRTSTWGVGFNVVARVLAAIMLSTAAIVGLVMYNRNKRKIRQGYIPGWDDEET